MVVDPNGAVVANATVTIANPVTGYKRTVSTKAEPLKGINADIAAMLRRQRQTPAPPAKRSITILDAVSIFLQQNLQLVAARNDIDAVDAEN